ncbi:MAG: AAA family ATPase [Dehalococcoidia bacterium]|nr:AAA family ATPase [Dehalococcoidia bacterium]
MPDRHSSSHRESDRTTTNTQTEELTGALRLPEAYPHKPESVGFGQTQMSLLFFAGEYVYKVKKPVNLGYLDYSTLDDRHRFCVREVELNRRLCSDTYLGVVPIVQVAGQYTFEGTGDPVEYAVKMRRLPQDRMLDGLLSRHLATEAMMDAIATRVASFHLHSESNADISSFGDLSTIRRNTDENFEQTEPNIGITVTESTLEVIRDYTNGFMQAHEPLFAQRLTDSRIKDCHGDLHAAHVCMTDDICIYDCIEFNDRFRYGDVASEVAFLAMDLDRFGRRDLSRTFVDSYKRSSKDEGIEALIRFYTCYRAVVRGKVEGFKLADALMPEEDKKTATWLARKYFHLAAGYARGSGMLIVMSGLTGSGKSTIAHELQRLLGCTVISADAVRKQLAGIPVDEHHYDRFNEGLYTPEWTQRTYDEMLTQANAVLSKGGCAILDASFLSARRRSDARQVAAAIGSRVLLVECVAPYEVMLQRLQARQAGISASDGRPEILHGQMETREPVTEFGIEEHMTVSAEQDTTTIVEQIWRRM